MIMAFHPGMGMADPLFTFGITTYNRQGMLKECLDSILKQTNPDFEVIVGNDFTDEILTCEMLGISDPRVRIINHPRTLGEINNMNYLLSEAKGKYFSWLADDDLLMPQFLEAIHVALGEFSYPLCIFPSYNEGTEYGLELVDINSSLRLMSGYEFLQGYLSRSLKLIGCYGGFKTEYLKDMGGIKALGDGFSPYADNLLAIKAGKLDRVVYIDAPLIFFRTHDQSMSYTSPDLTAYTSAQRQLLSECDDEIFGYAGILPRRDQIMFNLLIWCSRDIYSLLYRGASILSRPYIKHLGVLERYARSTGLLYPKFLLFNLWFVARYLAKSFLKRTA